MLPLAKHHHDGCIVEDTPPAGVQASFWCRTAGVRIGSCWGYARDRGAGMVAAMSPPDGMWEAADRGCPLVGSDFPDHGRGLNGGRLP